MAETRILDARGLSCPQPALQTDQTLKRLAGGIVEVLVDSVTSAENVTRIAQRAGWSVTAEQQPDGSFTLVLKK